MTRTRRFVLAILVAGLSLAWPTAQQRPGPSPDQYARLHWRTIGPEGNRFSAAAGIAGDPYTYYVGAASGGVWKTADGGTNWEPIFDDQPVQSIGSLAVAPSDPNIVWAGTGEGSIRSHISVGQGIYKSTDAGKTWALMGLEQTGRIPRVLVHPTDPDVVLACALGHAYGPQQERGVFRTTDGGRTWTRTLFTDENAGCSDIAMNPKNPRILLAGMWTLEIHTWGRDSGGPGSGLFMSRDGGQTWTKLTGGRGLPTKPVGKVAVAISASNPQRMYALIETGDGVPWKGQETERGQLWRTDDGGERWQIVSYDHNAMGRAHYYSRMAVAPDDPDEAYFLTASYARSIDGGKTLAVLSRGGGAEYMAPGGDHHDIWIDPTNANRQIVAHDQGLSITVNRGKTWYRQRLKNAQIYHVTVDNEIPYNVLGNKQDEPTYRGPSNSRLQGGFGGDPGIPRAMWNAVGGGESGWATPDPTNSNVVWSTASGSGMVGGIVVRYEQDRRQFRNIEIWPDQSNGPAEGVRYRFVWDAPLQISPHDHNTIYVGSQHVHRTTNGGQSWEVISPDLTLNDRARMGSSGGLTPDNIGVEYAGVVYGIAESPKVKGLIWAGTNDGQVQLTRDNGKSWTNVTKNIPGLISWGSVRSLAPSRYDDGTCFIAVDGHQVNSRDPWVYRTTDFGATWTLVTNGLPKDMLSYAKVIYEDPVRRGLLYLGTESGIYVTFDAGDTWQPLQNDLPHAPVSGIVVQEHFNDLVISTYGRGFWILDDITPLRAMTPDVLNQAAHLFPVRQAYRFRGITAPSTPYDDPTVGENPPYGAAINYYLSKPVTGGGTVTIADGRGQTVRTMRVPGGAGLNRVTWDLRYEPTKEMRFRTDPLYGHELPRENDDTRPPAAGGGRITILAPPGAYTVKLSIGGRDYQQPLTVLKDPHSGGTEADIQGQTTLLTTLATGLNAGVDAVNQLEFMRNQMQEVLRTSSEAEVKQMAQKVHDALTDREMNLYDLRITGGQDGVRYAAKLLSRFNYLANGVSGSDFKPTDQHQEVAKLLAERLQTELTAIRGLVDKDVTALNELLRRHAAGQIVTKAP
ncbi:MAG: WD40/YVTN/BNR-like repeat-containing protein [Vicinamibacterales bacterium]